MENEPKEIEFKSSFLKELRAKATPLDPELLKETEQSEHLHETFLTKYDTSSLAIEVD